MEVGFGTTVHAHLYSELTLPSFWAYATDDAIANIQNVEDMVRVSPNSKSEIKALHPRDYGYSDIGHMQFFSSRRKKLWPVALEWLNTKSLEG